MRRNDGPEELLTPGEVARMFGVNPKTITRWASVGKLSPIRTLGGHRRYRASEVEALLASANGEGTGHSDVDDADTAPR